jgi:hypothetical protein
LARVGPSGLARVAWISDAFIVGAGARLGKKAAQAWQKSSGMARVWQRCGGMARAW